MGADNMMSRVARKREAEKRARRAGQERSRVFGLRLTVAERAALEARASEMEMNESDFVRWAIRTARRRRVRVRTSKNK